MGQQLKARTKRKRRQDYLERKKIAGKAPVKKKAVKKKA